MALDNLAARLSGLGRRKEALTAAEEAVRLRRGLAEARPDAFTPDLAASLNTLANNLSALGGHENSLAAAEEAVSLYRALAEARPEAFTSGLAVSLNTLANSLSYLGQREEALAMTIWLNCGYFKFLSEPGAGGVGGLHASNIALRRLFYRVYIRNYGHLEKISPYGVMTGVRVRNAVDRSILGLSSRLPEVATGFSGGGLIGSTHATRRMARRFTRPRRPSFQDKRSGACCRRGSSFRSCTGRERCRWCAPFF